MKMLKKFFQKQASDKSSEIADEQLKLCKDCRHYLNSAVKPPCNNCIPHTTEVPFFEPK